MGGGEVFLARHKLLKHTFFLILIAVADSHPASVDRLRKVVRGPDGFAPVVSAPLRA